MTEGEGIAASKVKLEEQIRGLETELRQLEGAEHKHRKAMAELDAKLEAQKTLRV